MKAPGPLPVKASRGPGSGFAIGANAADARREPLGRVTDVIGPVSNPYVLITPARGARLHRVLGKDVYAIDRPPSRRRPARKGARDRRR